MFSFQECPFKLLGLIRSTATLETVAKAHRRLVFEAHPDKNPNNPNASSRTQLLNDAKDRANALLQPETPKQKQYREQQEEAKAQQEDALKAAKIKQQKEAEAERIKQQKDAEAAEVSRRLQAEAAKVWASLALEFGYDPFGEDFVAIRRLTEAELWKTFNCGADDSKAECVLKYTGSVKYELRTAIIKYKAEKEQEAQTAREQETRRLREQELKQREVQAAQELKAQKLRDAEAALELHRQKQDLEAQRLRDVEAALELHRQEQDVESQRLRDMYTALLQKQHEQELETQRLRCIEAARERELEAQKLHETQEREMQAEQSAAKNNNTPTADNAEEHQESAKKKRKHVKTWAGEPYQNDIACNIDTFIDTRIRIAATSKDDTGNVIFISSVSLADSFFSEHTPDDAAYDPAKWKFFFRCFRERMTSRYETDQRWKLAKVKQVRGYLGILMLPA